MAARSEVRCDGSECCCCYYARDKTENPFGKIIDVRCDASEAQRRKCGDGEKGYFDLPEPEIEFIEKLI